MSSCGRLAHLSDHLLARTRTADRAANSTRRTQSQSVATSSSPPPPLRVCVAGCTGGVGSSLVAAIVANPGFVLHSAVARTAAGQDAGSAIGLPACGVTIVASIDAALDDRTDVLIDYTHPSQRTLHVEAAVRRRIPAVIGTTGFTSAEFDALDRLAISEGVALATGNMSLTAACLQHFALQAAAIEQLQHWSIREVCKPDKPDVPSGTASELAELMAEVRPGCVCIHAFQCHSLRCC